MKFKVKYSDGSQSWWEDGDRLEVMTQRDAFLFGKVLVEYWNSGLQPGEKPRKVVNAVIVGKGKAKARFFPSPIGVSKEVH